eukprot:scaffold18613_cov112-Isochrysis_galbana.AAC.7
MREGLRRETHRQDLVRREQRAATIVFAYVDPSELALLDEAVQRAVARLEGQAQLSVRSALGGHGRGAAWRESAGRQDALTAVLEAASSSGSIHLGSTEPDNVRMGDSGKQAGLVLERAFDAAQFVSDQGRDVRLLDDPRRSWRAASIRRSLHLVDGHS